MEGQANPTFLFGFNVRHILAESIPLWHFFYGLDRTRLGRPLSESENGEKVKKSHPQNLAREEKKPLVVSPSESLSVALKKGRFARPHY
jgi:hypothetical protein